MNYETLRPCSRSAPPPSLTSMTRTVRTYLTERAKLAAGKPGKVRGTLVLETSATLRLFGLVAGVRLYVLSPLHGLYKECKTTPNYFSPTPT